ncbi:hypothetical protein DERP_007344 [Dermatophagoides pteronyssinus]|uniref:F-box domain-containing protein n=1 Tax=Dermatophagoides pteronyssinus TaxID=6956 RepID=A0ABQ8J4A7_DERPT|nr:hypothetical protein DERP_007344 [Dermatophagoides pteronyssinus]
MSIETILQNELIMEKIFDKIPIDKLFTKRFINQKFYQLILLYLKRREKIIDFLQITTATNNDDNEEDDNSQDANEDDVHKENFTSINPSLQTRYKLTLNFSYQYWLDDETLMAKIFNFNLIIMKNNNNNNKHEQQQQQQIIPIDDRLICCCCCLKSMTTTTTILENIYLDHCWNITNTRLLKIFTNCQQNS